MGFSGTVDRRDAAVAAALAGAVVVIVGYAAGLGIESTDAVAATEPPVAPSVPAAPVPNQASGAGAAPAGQAPALVAPAPAVPNVSVGSPDSPDPSTPSQPDAPGQPSSPADPHSPHSPHPSEPTPTPGDPTPSCAPGLLDDVPVIGAVTEAATTFLSGILDAVPVVDELVGGLFDCTVGTLVGSSCCGSEARLDEGTESGR